MPPENGKPRVASAGPQKDFGNSSTSKITTAARPSSFNRQPSRIDTGECWRAVYDHGGEVLGSIRLMSCASYEARDRLQRPIGLAFPSYDMALAALERGRP
jgi:hypothetical protein